jgi:hypothetical protein
LISLEVASVVVLFIVKPSESIETKSAAVFKVGVPSVQTLSTFVRSKSSSATVEPALLSLSPHQMLNLSLEDVAAPIECLAFAVIDEVDVLSTLERRTKLGVNPTPVTD